MKLNCGYLIALWSRIVEFWNSLFETGGNDRPLQMIKIRRDGKPEFRNVRPDERERQLMRWALIGLLISLMFGFGQYLFAGEPVAV